MARRHSPLISIHTTVYKIYLTYNQSWTNNSTSSASTKSTTLSPTPSNTKPHNSNNSTSNTHTPASPTPAAAMTSYSPPPAPSIKTGTNSTLSKHKVSSKPSHVSPPNSKNACLSHRISSSISSIYINGTKSDSSMPTMISMRWSTSNSPKPCFKPHTKFSSKILKILKIHQKSAKFVAHPLPQSFLHLSATTSTA
jgi:hypothetical protein